jgi:hypothetical protein
MAASNPRSRVLNLLAGKTQSSIYELYLAIPVDAVDADIGTRLMYDDIRTKLLAAFRATQVLYGMTALPVLPYDPCPCGCDATTPSGGAGTTEEP